MNDLSKEYVLKWGETFAFVLFAIFQVSFAWSVIDIINCDQSWFALIWMELNLFLRNGRFRNFRSLWYQFYDIKIRDTIVYQSHDITSGRYWWRSRNKGTELLKPFNVTIKVLSFSSWLIRLFGYRTIISSNFHFI